MKLNPLKKTPPSGVRKRLIALFLDWLFISAYLVLLFLVMMAFYILVLGEIPTFTNSQSQWMATLSTIVPIIILFTYFEGGPRRASLGKRKAQLSVAFDNHPYLRSLLRNTLKFLPWQFGHMSTIYGLYNGFDTPFSFFFLALSMSLMFIYVVMVFIRKDNRHLADIISGSRVIKEEKLRAKVV